MTLTLECRPDDTVIDVSNIPYQGEHTNTPTWEMATKIFFAVCLGIVSVFGNAVVIMIVARNKKMRTTTNCFIANLALSDLLVGCFPIWVHLVSDFTDDWTMGEFICKFTPFMQITAMLASTFSLIVIATDRFIAIMFPLKSRVIQRRVSVVTVTVWVLSVAISTPLIVVYVYEERPWKDHVEMFCTDIWPDRVIDGECDFGLTSKKAYWTFVCVVLNWIPMIVMAVSYIFILVKLRYNRILPSIGSTSNIAIQNRSKQKVVKMLFSVLVVFIICALPFQISKLYELYRKMEKESSRLPEWYDEMYYAAIFLMYANSGINPVIYAGLNENFRREFRQLVKRESRSSMTGTPVGSRRRTTTRNSVPGMAGSAGPEGHGVVDLLPWGPAASYIYYGDPEPGCSHASSTT